VQYNFYNGDNRQGGEAISVEPGTALFLKVCVAEILDHVVD